MKPTSRFLDGRDRFSVLGSGRTGIAVADFLSSQGKDVFLSEQNEISTQARRRFQDFGVAFEENGHTYRVLESEMVIPSPGVPLDHELLREARARGLEVMAEVELAYRLSPTDKVIAVTGTNGKTTTVNIIDSILKYCGERSFACGNIGKPFIEIIPELKPGDYVALELSSYQLLGIDKLRPRVAALLNLSPDHLKRHGSMENYREAKFRIFENQTVDDYAVVSPELYQSMDFDEVSAKVSVYRDDRCPFVAFSEHNRKNASAAVRSVGQLHELSSGDIPLDVFFRGMELPHRMEEVGVFGGVKYINDSKATNPGSTIAALREIREPFWLLLGGQAKRKEYSELAKEVELSDPEGVFAFGEDGSLLVDLLVEEGYEKVSFEGSMEKALCSAEENATPGDSILLSPGCASFDEFENFAERGELFSELVRNSAEEEPK